MKPRSITITPVLNGFVVNVGCQTVVMKSPEELGMNVAEYYKKPAEVEMRFCSEKVNNTFPDTPIAEECCDMFQVATTAPSVPINPDMPRVVRPKSRG